MILEVVLTRRIVKGVWCASLCRETKGRADRTKLFKHNEMKSCLPQSCQPKIKIKGGERSAEDLTGILSCNLQQSLTSLSNPKEVKPVWPKSRRTSAELDYRPWYRDSALISCSFLSLLTGNNGRTSLSSQSRWKVSETAKNVVIYATCGAGEGAWPIRSITGSV